jgi:hypothetical protein
MYSIKALAGSVRIYLKVTETLLLKCYRGMLCGFHLAIFLPQLCRPFYDESPATPA